MNFLKSYLHLIFSLIISVCIIFNLSLSSQEISTVAEIYDFEVGDIYHYYSDYYHSTVHKTIYEITNKYYSPDNDTLYYIRDYQEAWRSFQDSIWNYSFGTQTIYFIELNSLINDGVINTIYSDPLQYNGRLINANWVCEDEVVKFAVGCGLVWDYLTICGTGEFIHDIELEYYKKGEEEWGTSLNLYTDIPHANQNSEISIFPNPAKETIYIKFLSNNKVTNPTLELMTLTGNLIKTFKLNNSLSSISIGNLPAGIYLYVVKSGTNVLKEGKLIKQ